MRTLVIVQPRGAGYIASIQAPAYDVHGVRIGVTAFAAAVKAAQLMIDHAQTNAAGGDLLAPEEVRDLVPTYLREIPPQS